MIKSFENLIKNMRSRISKSLYSAVREEIRGDITITYSIVNAMIEMQKTFSKYKNANAGKDVVIIATGPSLDEFKPIENAVYIGMNKCVLYDKVKFDYIFMQDYGAVADYIEEITKDRFKDTRRFYGIMPQGYYNEIFQRGAEIPESIAIRHNAERYYVPIGWSEEFQRVYPLDISSQIMAIGGSVVSAAFQFALYTNPKRIYLAGCDVSGGHFGGDKMPSSDQTDMVFWSDRKRFAEIWYPETEIISINPRGLKGMFKDMYQS